MLWGPTEMSAQLCDEQVDTRGRHRGLHPAGRPSEGAATGATSAEAPPDAESGSEGRDRHELHTAPSTMAVTINHINRPLFVFRVRGLRGSSGLKAELRTCQSLDSKLNSVGFLIRLRC